MSNRVIADGASGRDRARTDCGGPRGPNLYAHHNVPRPRLGPVIGAAAAGTLWNEAAK